MWMRRMMWAESDQTVEAQSVNSVGADHSSVQANGAKMQVDEAFADALLREGRKLSFVPG